MADSRVPKRDDSGAMFAFFYTRLAKGRNHQSLIIMIIMIIMIIIQFDYLDYQDYQILLLCK
jgi:hypothetical protein